MDWTDLRDANDRLAGERLAQSNITCIYIGYKDVTVPTGPLAVVVGVEEKRPLSSLSKAEAIPATVRGFPTDVVETGTIIAYPQTAGRRPAPAGYSVGHFRITAGTLGCWVRRGTSERSHILSNNHVLANSNAAMIGDPILQPGRADLGMDPRDRIASLTEYVRIRFEGDGGKKRKAMSLWSLAKAGPNAIARLVGCPYRLVVTEPRVVLQPYPNLVDAAVAVAAREQDVDRSVALIGEITGIRDFTLGDAVQKSGRTTDRTQSGVIGVNGFVNVSYGARGLARFQRQNLMGGVGFSAPGDSGSAILGMDRRIGGLLFAGGSNVTIANRASDVFALLGLRL